MTLTGGTELKLRGWRDPNLSATYLSIGPCPKKANGETRRPVTPRLSWGLRAHAAAFQFCPGTVARRHQKKTGAFERPRYRKRGTESSGRRDHETVLLEVPMSLRPGQHPNDRDPSEAPPE